MPGRRYNCACGKKRYRDESSALAAAAVDESRYQVATAVYRCPGGLAWHVTCHGFIPEALKSVGRRLAYELAEHGQVDPSDFSSRISRAKTQPDPRRQKRARQCIEQMISSGLARWATGHAETEGYLFAANVPGLRRIVQVGLDAYQREQAADPGANRTRGTP